MEHITFSDSLKTEGENFTFLEAKDLTTLSLEEYCKHHPDSPECLEYDV
jgi:hypothetical protein